MLETLATTQQPAAEYRSIELHIGTEYKFFFGTSDEETFQWFFAALWYATVDYTDDQMPKIKGGRSLQAEGYMYSFHFEDLPERMITAVKERNESGGAYAYLVELKRVQN